MPEKYNNRIEPDSPFDTDADRAGHQKASHEQDPSFEDQHGEAEEYLSGGVATRGIRITPTLKEGQNL